MERTAAIYLRVSTDEQTVENQRAPLLSLAASRGWKTTLYEETESAAKRRPVFEAMLSAVHRGEHCAVVVAALDRLGRSLSGVLETVRKLDELNVPVVSVREPWLDMQSPARSLLVAIFAWVAEQERAVLIDRTKAGIRRARKQGVHLGRKTLETDPKRAELAEKLRRALSLVHAGTHSPAQAAAVTGASARTLARRVQASAKPPASIPPSPVDVAGP